MRNVILRKPYRAHRPDIRGRVRYTAAEQAVWAELHARQMAALPHCACAEFLHGLSLLRLPADRVPQLAEVSARLRRETGWEVVPVPALIDLPQFFSLLSQRRFPAATFLRRREHLDYLPEPDLFHEIFGHAPLLTDPYFAAFTRRYGELGLEAAPEDREILARLYWYTVEFGLLQRPGAPLQVYGGGILSSIAETDRAILDPTPQRRRFSLDEVLRMPYRIDLLQPLYFVIENLQELYEVMHSDVPGAIARARRLGPLPPPALPHTAKAA